MSDKNVSYLVTRLKQKIAIATAISVIKLSKSQGLDPVTFAKDLQKYYFKQKEESLPPAIVQRNLKFWQEEAMKNLKNIVPFHPCSTEGDHDVTNESQDDPLDWFDDEADNAGVIERTIYNPTTITQLQNPSIQEESYLRNARFLESIMRLSEESDNNSTIPTSQLHSLLYDKADQTSKTLRNNNSYISLQNKFSDDSGLGYSEEYPIMKFVSSDIIKHSLESTDASYLLTLSLKDVVNYLRKMLASHCEEIFYEWKGSFNEHVCNLIRRCSRVNPDCRDVVVNFIVEIIGECWNDHRSFIHIYSEKKLLIIEELIGDIDICYEVLQNLREKFAMFNTYLTKNHKDVPVVSEKLSLFLNLYCRTCDTIKTLQKNSSLSRNNKSKKQNVEEQKNLTVSELWLEQWCPKDKDGESPNLTQQIEDHDIEVLERLLISVSRYPLIGIQIVEALNSVRSLKIGNATPVSS